MKMRELWQTKESERSVKGVLCVEWRTWNDSSDLRYILRFRIDARETGVTSETPLAYWWYIKGTRCFQFAGEAASRCLHGPLPTLIRLGNYWCALQVALLHNPARRPVYAVIGFGMPCGCGSLLNQALARNSSCTLYGHEQREFPHRQV